MDPRILSLLAGSGIFAALFPDRTAENQIKRAQSVANPRMLAQYAELLYNLLRGSPAFSSAEGGVLRGASRAQESIKQSLAERGILKTGIGAIGTGVASGLAATHLGRLRGELFARSTDQALDLIRTQVGAIGQIPLNRSIGRDVFAAGLDILPLLFNRNRPAAPSSLSTQDINDRFSQILSTLGGR